MAVQSYLITGIASDRPHPRKNINGFAKDPLQWNLFLQALLNLQAQGEDTHTPLGFYQIAGVHGAPYIQWLEEVDADDRPGNYCTHGTALFLTWHRPFVMLLEQRIVEEALGIARTFSDKYRSQYEEAALAIRLPYWDWATDSDIPQSVRFPTTDITLPVTGSDAPPVTQKGVSNPLYSYKFKTTVRRQRDFSVTNIPEMIRWEETKRCPDPEGNSHPEIADKQLRGPIPPDTGLLTDFHDGVYKLLTLVDSYGSFGNTGWKPQLPGADHISVESYHNVIHNYVGTNFGAETVLEGHMTEVPVSAFDPIFWLHHCNIDRIYALWQAIHYESVFEDQDTDFTRLPLTKAIDNAETTLRPFYKAADVPWTSSMVQKSSSATGPTVFDYNYHYPELPVELSGPEQQSQMALHVSKRVHELYGPSTNVSLVDVPKVPDRLLPPKHVVQLGKFRREWLVFLHVKKFLVPGNFMIFFFLGEPKDAPHTWIKSKNFVGTVSTFKGNTEYCANCATQDEGDVMISGGVDLTNCLYNALVGTDINLDDEEGVEGWLKENLHWRIMKDDKTELKPNELQKSPDSLSVGVKSFVMLYPTDKLPIDGHEFQKANKIIDEKVHFTITESKRHHGGLGAGDTY